MSGPVQAAVGGRIAVVGCSDCQQHWLIKHSDIVLDRLACLLEHLGHSLDIVVASPVDHVVQVTNQIQARGEAEVDIEVVEALSGGSCRLNLAANDREWRVNMNASRQTSGMLG